MAKIQNPQDQFGRPLSTIDYVDASQKEIFDKASINNLYTNIQNIWTGTTMSEEARDGYGFPIKFNVKSHLSHLTAVLKSKSSVGEMTVSVDILDKNLNIVASSKDTSKNRISPDSFDSYTWEFDYPLFEKDELYYVNFGTKLLFAGTSKNNIQDIDEDILGIITSINSDSVTIEFGTNENNVHLAKYELSAHSVDEMLSEIMTEKIPEAMLDIVDGNNNDDLHLNIPQLKVQGDFCNLVVENDTEGNPQYILYINKNNNHPKYTAIKNLTGSTYYLCSKAGVNLPTGKTAGNTYSVCLPDTTSLTLILTNNDEEGRSMGNFRGSDYIKLYVNNNEVAVSKTFAEMNAGSRKAPGSYEESAAENKITFTLTDLIKYTNDDAADGFTPNTYSANVKIVLKNNYFLNKGNTYKFKVETSPTLYRESNEIYVYDSTPENTPSISTPTLSSPNITYSWVSGIKYIKSYSTTISVSNIKNTEQWITKDTNRIYISGIPSQFDKSNGARTVNNLTYSESSNYSFTETYSIKSNLGVFSLSGTIKVTPYGQTALAADGTAKNVSLSNTGWAWTVTTPDDSTINSDFKSDNNRLAATLSSNGVTLVGSNGAYNSEKNIVTGGEGYNNQLLVQDGKLRHPSKDSTSTYKGTTGARYYFKHVRNTSASTDKGASNFTITLKGITSFGSANTEVWLYSIDNTYKARLDLESTKNYGVAAPGATISNGTWKCAVPTTESGGKTLYLNEGFYLVIKMTENSPDITGPLTITFE